jgi:peroxiredoxin Q/BCP
MNSQRLRIGDPAPEFTLPDQEGKSTSLRDLLDLGCLVLYFYPKDETPGCTAEACSFRDEHEQFAEAGARVVGVSSDDVDSHRRFIEKHQLPFRLLSDRGGQLRKSFGVPKTFGLIDGRVTYVIDSNGIIRLVFNSQLRATQHIEEALRIVRSLAPSKSASIDGARDARR